MREFTATFLVALTFSVGFGFLIIPLLKKLKFGQNILNYVIEHNYKSGTPTMGGVIFAISGAVSFFFFTSGDNHLSLVCIAVGLSYMLVGFLDDFIKIKLKRNMGLSGWQKTFFELVIALVVSIFAYSRGLTKIYIPFTGLIFDLGWWFIPLCVFVFIATTNSVNLTDGLDGLAGGITYIFLIFIGGIIALQTKKFNINYVNLAEYKNLSVLAFALSGGVVGYLLFNTHKASVFMGDTGSLSLGGFVAIISIVSGNMLFIPIIGITYVASSISVILQVIYYKKTKKRIFLMAPLHHHFQQKGYEESKIAVGYKIVTLFLGLICAIFYM